MIKKLKHQFECSKCGKVFKSLKSMKKHSHVSGRIKKELKKMGIKYETVSGMQFNELNWIPPIMRNKKPEIVQSKRKKKK